jgi:hypothetical protein
MPYFFRSIHRHRASGSFMIGDTGGGARVTKLYQPSHDEIARLAYSYWQARHGQGGSAYDDWLRAEKELREYRGRR